jgi:hypothetical protein
MKTFALSLLAALVGYAGGLFGGMLVVESFSSNMQDRSLEAAMTGAFVLGPAAALIFMIGTIVHRSKKTRSL